MSLQKTNDIKIGIIGLGLIGGSLAKAFSGRGKVFNIVAVDVNEISLKKAYEDKSISEYSTEITAIADCDVLFICVSPDKTKDILKEISPWYKGLVTDVASAKYKLYKYATNNFPNLRYIPVHPMAGSERVGYDAAKENLFENAPFIICTDFALNNEKDSYQEDIDLLKQFAHKLMARPIEMDINEHDKAVGLISHLPHIIAYSLVNLVKESNNESIKEIAAGGFKDLTRIASANPTLWTDIVCQSSDALVLLIDQYLDIMSEMRADLKDLKKESLEESFNSAKKFRDNLSSDSKAKNRYVQIWVDVDDKPGVIGQVAVILGENHINIKNINIQDNREYEGGCMRITLTSIEDAKKSVDILSRENLRSWIVD